jgi:transcriptional regulator with XRE-family HTH domain
MRVNGPLIRSRRKLLKIKRGFLIEKLGISESMYARYLFGSSRPSDERLDILCKYLKVTKKQLLEGCK